MRHWFWSALACGKKSFQPVCWAAAGGEPWRAQLGAWVRCCSVQELVRCWKKGTDVKMFSLKIRVVETGVWICLFRIQFGKVGNCSATCRRLSALIIFLALQCKPQDFSNIWEEGRRRDNLKTCLLPGREDAQVHGWKPVPSPSCEPGTARTVSLSFSEKLPGFDQYFHLAAEKKISS